MKYMYSLRINVDGNPSQVTRILGIKPTKADDVQWEYEAVERAEDVSYDFVNEFLDLLEGKYDELRRLGIETDDITIWMLYEYDQECNMEFSPKGMKRLGDAGITLCVSCWQKGGTIDF